MLSHKLWTGVLVVVALLVLGAAFGEEPKQAGPETRAETAVSVPSPDGTTPPVPIVEVPRLEGMSLSEAETVLEASGLSVTTVEKYSREKANTVLRVSIDPGTDVQEGTIIQVVIAKSLPTVPYVAGKSKAKAIQLLKEQGFRVDVVAEDSPRRDGVVLGLEPRAGTPLLPNRVVTLVVADQVEPPPPPCDSNYSGYCVPIVSYDLDCEDVGSNFQVTGVDRHGFDGDNDGYACET